MSLVHGLDPRSLDEVALGGPPLRVKLCVQRRLALFARSGQKEVGGVFDEGAAGGPTGGRGGRLRADLFGGRSPGEKKGEARPSPEAALVSDDEGGDREHDDGHGDGDADLDEIARPWREKHRDPSVDSAEPQQEPQHEPRRTAGPPRSPGRVGRRHRLGVGAGHRFRVGRGRDRLELGRRRGARREGGGLRGDAQG